MGREGSELSATLLLESSIQAMTYQRSDGRLALTATRGHPAEIDHIAQTFGPGKNKNHRKTSAGLTKIGNGGPHAALAQSGRWCFCISRAKAAPLGFVTSLKACWIYLLNTKATYEGR